MRLVFIRRKEFIINMRDGFRARLADISKGPCLKCFMAFLLNHTFPGNKKYVVLTALRDGWTSRFAVISGGTGRGMQIPVSLHNKDPPFFSLSLL